MSTFDLLAAGLLLVPALVWTIIARHTWSPHVSDPGRVFQVMPAFAAAVAINNFVHVAWVLLHVNQQTAPAFLVVIHEVSNVAIAALGRHMLRVMPLPENPPGRTWLALNYGPAALACVLYAATHLLPGTTASQQQVAELLRSACFSVLGVLFVWQFVRSARPGVSGPEVAAEVRRSDLHVVAAGAAAGVVVFLVVTALGEMALARVLLEACLFLAMAGPWVVRLLGIIIPEFLVATVMLAATAGVFVAHAATLPLVDARYRPLLDFGAILLLGGVLSAAPGALREWAVRLVLRRNLRQHAELQAFLHRLSPELGTHECCRRALAEIVSVRQLRGAAILLRDGEAIVHGSFNLTPVARVWPRGADADALPARPFGTAELRALPLPLREALIAANVALGAAPITSPRRRWGLLFLNTGLLGGAYREDDFETLEAFVSQLGLLLDSADLLGRTVAVERSLAHAEKLAAIGETAARIAHEIRNPVTAARSLAQQLARDPTSPLNTEAATLILEELERVERQVVALLRFARREEFRFETVDLGELVRTTVEQTRPRLAQGGIEVALELADGLQVRADREKVRQVLVNLIDNAIDALRRVSAGRRLAVAVGRVDGVATVEVADSGPGVAADALPRLFEPFFSLKEHGTGLGLAIAKRTIDAHGGRIDAACPTAGGMVVRVDLPLASPS